MTRTRWFLSAVLLLTGPALATAAAPRLTPPPGPPSAQFPVAANLAERLAEARQLIAKESWPEAVRRLRAILDAPDGLFPAPDADGRQTWIGGHTAALRLLAALPADAQTQFEGLSEPAACELLRAVRAKENEGQLFEVFARFPGTDAAGEAVTRLAVQAAEAGDYGVSARWFKIVLAQPRWADKVAPLALYYATVSACFVGDAESAARSWKRLADKVGDKPVRVEGRLLRLDELKKEVAQVTAPAVRADDWPIYRGDPSRSVPGKGRAPVPEPKWKISTLPGDIRHQSWVLDCLNAAETDLVKRGLPILPAFHPIIVDGKLLFRTYEDLLEFDLRQAHPSDRQRWRLADGGAEAVLGDPNKKKTIDSWKKDYLEKGPQGILFENSVTGTLSSDGTRVLLVDDLLLPPRPMYQFGQWGRGLRLNHGYLNDQVNRNSLKAFHLDSFKLVWELGKFPCGNADLDKLLGVLDEGGNPPTLEKRTGSFFLGPPLPLGGELFVLHETGHELHLLCLAPQDRPADRVPLPPSLVWSKPLLTVRDTCNSDSVRRIHAAHLAHADGILVCPTNAGVIVGVDVRTRRIAWVHRYAAHRRPLALDPRALVNEWKVTAPAIHAGKVIFTAPDSGVLSCLDLREGRLLWQVERDEDDCYFAGLCDGKALIVGTKSVRAVDVGSGKEVWKLETDMPSGQGVVGGKLYYLPVLASARHLHPGICAIDVSRGRVLAHIAPVKADDGLRAPGNLLFYQDQLISQSVNRVTSYPLVKE